LSRGVAAQRNVDLLVIELTDDGLGRGTTQDREIRLRNALPGESVSGVVRKRQRRIWYGDAVTLQTASADRAPAPCPVVHRCGGCTLQHLLPEAELAFKQASMLKQLARCGITPAVVRDPVPGPLHGYRRKARIGVRRVGDHVFAGFREAFSGRVVDMRACTVLDGRLSTLLSPLRDVLGATSIAGRIPQVELAAGDDSTAIVIRHLEPFSPDDEALLRDFASAQRTTIHLQPGGPETVQYLAGERAQLSFGNPDFGLSFVFEPLDFVQVNAVINRLLVRKAVLALQGSGRVLDLFCGLGNFSLALARQGMEVIGVEASDTAVAGARMNASRNRLHVPVTFARADLYAPAETLDGLGDACDALVLDPPRSGAGPNLHAWLHAGIRKVVYVSCNPVTFATDAVTLAGAGFRLVEAGIYDMFPQTTHMETLGVFVRD